MRKGCKNTRFHDSRDIHKAFAKLYNRVDNNMVDEKTARLLLAILNGMSANYKVLELEDRCEELEDIVNQIRGDE
jgi:proteasome assembly chaperone (PAC2) family protein